jgi:hypothetical protein
MWSLTTSESALLFRREQPQLFTVYETAFTVISSVSFSVFRYVTCVMVDMYQLFGRTFCLHRREILSS